jgi:hypothetical protein
MDTLATIAICLIVSERLTRNGFSTDTERIPGINPSKPVVFRLIIYSNPSPTPARGDVTGYFPIAADPLPEPGDGIGLARRIARPGRELPDGRSLTVYANRRVEWRPSRNSAYSATSRRKAPAAAAAYPYHPASRRPIADVQQRMARGIILRLLNIHRRPDKPVAGHPSLNQRPGGITDACCCCLLPSAGWHRPIVEGIKFSSG